jgi:hypothetical protein
MQLQYRKNWSQWDNPDQQQIDQSRKTPRPAGPKTRKAAWATVPETGLRLGQGYLNCYIIFQVAGILEVDAQTIIDDLLDGKTLVEIAESYDVSKSTLIQELQEPIVDIIDAAVIAGKLNETQAEQIISDFTEYLTRIVESSFDYSDRPSSNLSAPSDLTATAESSGKIFLEWDSVDDATSYTIYRATSYSGTYSKIDTVTASHYTDSGLSEDTTYYYMVKAVNSSGTSAYSSSFMPRLTNLTDYPHRMTLVPKRRVPAK